MSLATSVNPDIDGVLKVAVVGEFQIGKSTLINCILKQNKAETGQRGGGISTTHKNSSYSLLGRFEIIDTPGFNAGDSDDETAEQAIKEAEVVLVVKSRKQLDDTYRTIIRRIKEKRALFLFNCSNPECWSPDDDNNSEICEIIGHQLKNEALDKPFVPINGKIVTPVNILWASFGLNLTDEDDSKKISRYLRNEEICESRDDTVLRQAAFSKSGFAEIQDYIENLPLNLLLHALQNSDKLASDFADTFCDKFFELVSR